MSKIEKVIREIDNLRDFYSRTQKLRSKIKKSASMKTQVADKTNSSFIVAEDVDAFDK
jgi:hypothetical protein